MVSKNFMKEIFKEFRKLGIRDNWYVLFIIFCEVHSKSSIKFKEVWDRVNSSKKLLQLLEKLKKVNPRVFNYLSIDGTDKELEIIKNYLRKHTEYIDKYFIGYFYENVICSDRKGKGVFYTPKEIVMYMCFESLKAWSNTYFQENKLIECNSDLEGFKEYLLNLDSVSREKYLEKLKTITILDPACGGIAFLIYFHELLCSVYELLEVKITEYNYVLEILSNNLFGIDINQEIINVSRMIQWSIVSKESMCSKNVFNLICGNTLLYSKEELISEFEKNRNI